MNNRELMDMKCKCPDQIINLIVEYLNQNSYKLEEHNIGKNEINLDDGTKINFLWNDYTMQIGISGSRESFDYKTFISLPTTYLFNFHSQLLKEQMYPVGVYTLLSNVEEKIILACNPYIFDEDVEKNHDTLKQWESVKGSKLEMNPTPFLQIVKYSPDDHILHIEQSEGTPLSYDKENVNLSINYNPYMRYSTLCNTIENALICTERFMTRYTTQKKNMANR